jgi:uncharacterized membrane protein YozB (DUF420 family)
VILPHTPALLALSLADFPFPPVNATLNGLSAILLVIALICIKSGSVRGHVFFIVSALTTSTIFLACYITFHTYRAMHGISVTRFPASNPLKLPYQIILLTHTILAVATVPLVIITLTRALRKQWDRHRQIAVWTFPIWLYVSVTGVIIYWMLSAAGAYHHQ